jgi:ferredoxin
MGEPQGTLSTMPKIRFFPEKTPNESKEVEANPGETLVQAAFRAGVVIQQTCGGTPSCTDCRVKILDNWENALEPPEGPEVRLTGNVYFITHERLSCQAIIKESCSVYVPSPKIPDGSKKAKFQRSNRDGKEEKNQSEKSDKKSS